MKLGRVKAVFDFYVARGRLSRAVADSILSDFGDWSANPVFRKAQALRRHRSAFFRRKEEAEEFAEYLESVCAGTPFHARLEHTDGGYRVWKAPRPRLDLRGEFYDRVREIEPDTPVRFAEEREARMFYTALNHACRETNYRAYRRTLRDGTIKIWKGPKRK